MSRKYVMELTQGEVDVIRYALHLARQDADDSADMSPELTLKFREEALKALHLVHKLNEMENCA